MNTPNVDQTFRRVKGTVVAKLTKTSATWDTFERKAAQATPPEPLSAKRCWIGVLPHDRDPQESLSDLDPFR